MLPRRGRARREDFLAWLAARAAHGTTVATMRDVVGGDVQPGVAGPPPEHARDRYNLLANASLERDLDRNGVPDCWQRGGSGDNDAVYALTDQAADGAVAQRIDITRLASGARRLVSAQDLGGCARVIDPLRAYVVRARYVASAPPRFSVYVRDASGWRSLATSPAFPPSPTYTTARYALPALPAVANGLSVGMMLGEPGSLIVDAFTLVTAEARSDDMLDHQVDPGRIDVAP